MTRGKVNELRINSLLKWMRGIAIYKSKEIVYDEFAYKRYKQNIRDAIKKALIEDRKLMRLLK